ncbi:hypothetical protein CYMTET_44996 [Cymbomonas tetramitiformis]|uniref:Uncharacterized protein n=1 Tax=Cymbomonas tetramitiformis TaxID=36881 RepID=A0AAE0BZ39_9CHLO|nr:hypothetical protein CYMTET_44996 [Cymbomonas tetramitiformis]
MATMNSVAARQSALVVEDLIQGLNEWRNIQDIVRLTFKAFHDVLKAQGDAIKTLERSVENKANKSEVTNSLQQKVGVTELNAKLLEVNTLLASKVDVTEMTQEMDRMAKRSEVEAAWKASAAETRGMLEMRATCADFEAFRDESDRMIQTMRTELNRKAFVEDVLTRLETKVGQIPVSSEVGEPSCLVFTEII